MQAGPLSLNITDYQSQGDELYTQFQNRAGNYGTADPDYLVHHAYSTDPTSSGDFGDDVHQNILSYIQTKWSGIPVLATEWNVMDAPVTNNETGERAAYNATSPQYRLGMERAWRMAALFDTMVKNNVQGANFWPVLQDSGTSMFKFWDQTPYISADTFVLLRNLWLGLWWKSSTQTWENTNPMRRADVVYTPVGGGGTAIEVFGYCQQNKRRARVFIAGRGAVAQDVKIKILGMKTTVESCTITRLSGPTGQMVFNNSTTPPTATVQENISISYQGVNGGHEFTVPVRDTTLAYELIMLDVKYPN
jgi:hypothetical protein